MNRNRLYMCVLLVWISSQLFGAEDSPKKIIKNVEKRLNAAKTVKISFVETYVWTMTGEEQSMEGELLLGEKDCFRIITEEQVIVSDGETLYSFNEPSNRVVLDRLANSDNTLLPRQILFQFKKDYQARVEGKENVGDILCTILLFTANTGDVFVPKIRVWVDTREWVPRKVEQIDLNENSVIYLLEEIEIDVPVKKDTFKIHIPEGAEVVDMRW